jgi:hypothetical protein
MLVVVVAEELLQGLLAVLVVELKVVQTLVVAMAVVE